AQQVVEPRSASSSAARRLLTALTPRVETATLFGVAQNLVRGVDFAKSFLGFGVVGIAVGVIVACQPPKGSFDLLRRGLAGKTEYRVRVAHGAVISSITGSFARLKPRVVPS